MAEDTKAAETAKAPEAKAPEAPKAPAKTKAASRTIHNSVRVDVNQDRGDGKVSHSTRMFNPGDEDELAEALSKEDIQRLTDQGAISGFVAPSKKE